ncbi:MAG TPA: ABC transporter permease [Candidatus Limnocylindrales bacterium]|nr:ABC transporter permease [Candidatus Limnocylindrales bacterium]
MTAAWRSFSAAARIGWAVDANWTDPFVFLALVVAKPLSAALILVVMVQVISGGNAGPLIAFVVVGSGLWSMVTAGIAGLPLSVLDDRERYRMLKYLYVSPADFLLVLLGRGVGRILVGAVGSVVTLAVGIVVLGIPFDPGRIDWPLFVWGAGWGFVMVVALSVVLAAVCLQVRQEAWSYPEAAAGALFLVTGAVFPLGVLPGPLQALGLITPLTWWIAAVRTALFPGSPSSIGGEGSLFASLAGHVVPTSAELAIALLATGAVGTLASVVVFRLSERRAKDRGLIDQTTGS